MTFKPPKKKHVCEAFLFLKYGYLPSCQRIPAHHISKKKLFFLGFFSHLGCLINMTANITKHAGAPHKEK